MSAHENETRETIAEFIKRVNISIEAHKHFDNQYMSDSNDMDHWAIVLSRYDTDSGRKEHKSDRPKQFKTYFSQGYGFNGKPPKAEDVLDCMRSDASGIDQEFEEWAVDLGYDADSRQAERTYEMIQEQTAKLKAWLGETLFDALMECESL